MIRTIVVGALAAALTIGSGPGAVAAPAQKTAPSSTDWTKLVADTGLGYRMGNPKAATRLVEYGSMNCPHCAAFENAASPAIRKLVASGRMSFEFRPKQLFPHDPSATLLAHCVGKGRFFAFTHDYMGQAPAVLERLRAAFRANPAGMESAGKQGISALALTMAKIGHMAPIAARHGVGAERAAQCLGDPKLIARVDSNEQAAIAAGVTGTPTFFINGKRANPEAIEKLGIPVAL